MLELAEVDGPARLALDLVERPAGAADHAAVATPGHSSKLTPIQRDRIPMTAVALTDETR